MKVWLCGTISESLVANELKLEYTAKDVWEALEKNFHDNKRSRIMELYNDLRSLQLGDKTIEEYFSRIQVITNLMLSLGFTVTGDGLVTFTVNGLGERFDQVASIILHRDPFPDINMA